MRKTRSRSIFVLTVGAMLVSIVAIAGPAIAKGPTSGHGGGHHTTSATGSFALKVVTDVNGDGKLNYGDSITFTVSSSATYPFVDLDCYQGTTLVLHQGVGFYGGYPFSQVFNLKGWAWPGGAADCTATLYSTDYDGSNYTFLSSASYHVYA
jgi:hypothetical protein